MDEIVLVSMVTTVVNVLLWVTLAIVVGLTVRGKGRVLWIIACAVPLLVALVNLVSGFVLSALAREAFTGVYLASRGVNLVFNILGIALLCAAVVVASRNRVTVAGGLR